MLEGISILKRAFQGTKTPEIPCAFHNCACLHTPKPGIVSDGSLATWIFMVEGMMASSLSRLTEQQCPGPMLFHRVSASNDRELEEVGFVRALCLIGGAAELATEEC
jgi:hypothetical protein